MTAQYVDTESRVKTMQASVDRVRALMSQATRLADIVSLEAGSPPSGRPRGDADAMAALDDAVALAPVEVRLSTDEQVLEDADDDTGFLAGLTAGWTAFTTSVGVLLTVIGGRAPVRRGPRPGGRPALDVAAAPRAARCGAGRRAAAAGA